MPPLNQPIVLIPSKHARQGDVMDEADYQPTDFARSSSEDGIPPLPLTQERKVLRSLKDEWKHHVNEGLLYEGYHTNKEMLIADLDEFDIYRSPTTEQDSRKFELIGLHYLEVPHSKKLCFDGVIRLGAVKHYVQRVSIEDSSIEGYCDDKDPNIVTFVRSEMASKDTTHDIWFRLRKPSSSYKRFHDPYLWVAQLAKHVIDYISDQPPESVGLESFREDFHQWLLPRFGKNPAFQLWQLAFKMQKDFRVAVNAYIEFLYREAYYLPDSNLLLSQPLWGHCMAKGLTSIKLQPQVVKHTLATPYVYKYFEHMYFGNNIRAMSILDKVEAQQDRRKLKLGFLTHAPLLPYAESHCQPYRNSPVQVGDVIGFNPDKKDTQVWSKAGREWLAYVQDIQPLNNGSQRLGVIFFYRPSDTNIFKAKYGLENELFFSDNCNCGNGELLSTDINGRYDVDWKPKNINAMKRFFVRQTYITQESAFVSLKEEHKKCICKTTEDSRTKAYHCGDTVYITKNNGGCSVLEPVVIQHVDEESGFNTVRRLLRLSRDCTQLAIKAKRTAEIADNELVLTDNYERVKTSRIQRRCHVRFVKKEDLHHNRVPFPYSRDGVGDFWFIAMGIVTSGDQSRLTYIARLPDCFNEGPEFNRSIHSSKKLKGLSIFSGGGNLDRGLEEGGAVEFQNAVDLDASAIHTQRANARDPSGLRLFWGSVDDYLRLSMSGTRHNLVARIGEVELIAAGSPCPGFSSLQKNFLSEASLRNASHISTFCSFVDLYRPEYGILENVVNMGSTRTGLEEQNVLSQLVACLVSMGYQVNQYIMDAWNYGSAQHRSRVFLTIAAPGLDPIIQPWHTHSRPYEDTLGKSLGKLPNGQRFGEREHYPTPFPHRSAANITSDLPSIGNGNVQTCISHPDHRVPRAPPSKDRALIRCIPRHPPGCGYKEAFHRGLIPSALQRPGKEHGKGFKRIKKAGLVPTITTGLSPQDAHNGACLHWSQDRSITLLDARRTQGYLDNEVIVGNPTEQYKVTGNGVDRKVSFVLGLALHQAFEENIKGLRMPTREITPVEEMLVDLDETIIEPEEMLVDAEGLNNVNDTTATTSTIPMQRKRLRDYNEEGLIGSFAHDRFKKQGRMDDKVRASSYERETIAVKVSTPKDKSTISLSMNDNITVTIPFPTNTANSDTRQTRHSGLDVTFTPRRWDVWPEREHSTSTKSDTC